MDKLHILLRRVHPDAKVPVYASDGAAAMDFYAVEDVYLGEKPTLVRTGWEVAIPEGYVGLTRPRGGHAFRDGILHRHSGVIDSDYRGELKFGLSTSSSGRISGEFEVGMWIHKGERFGQMLIVPVVQVGILEVEALTPTRRGAGELNSTGKD